MRQERHGHTDMPEFVEMNPFASQCKMRDFQNLLSAEEYFMKCQVN